MTDRIGVSLRLVAPGVVLGSVAGVLLGAWLGAGGPGLARRGCMVAAIVTISVPGVVIAVVLQVGAIWLNQATGVELLRTTGEATPGAVAGAWSAPLDRARHLVLPTLALALPHVAVLGLYQRALTRRAARSDFVRTARAKGLSRGTALRRHALRALLMPALSYASFTAAGLFAGAVFVERVYGWYGVGDLLLLRVVLDPRVRAG